MITMREIIATLAMSNNTIDRQKIKKAIEKINFTNYRQAMGYLYREDYTLHSSIRLAVEKGILNENTNSKTLATLMLQHNLLYELSQMSNAHIEEFFEKCKK